MIGNDHKDVVHGPLRFSYYNIIDQTLRIDYLLREV